MPRWVIGPSPGNENGWAFSESDAPTPHEVDAMPCRARTLRPRARPPPTGALAAAQVLATWISWDGFEWHSCKSFRYVAKEDEMDGLSEDEDYEDFEDEEMVDEYGDDDISPALSGYVQRESNPQSPAPARPAC